MRLIHTNTLKLHEFVGNKIPKYAILSHRWGDDEVTFAQFPDVDIAREQEEAPDWSADSPTLYNGLEERYSESWQKVLSFCSLVRTLGIQWAWMDTCCIDKSSSAELSEAINSMFTWYKQATICVAHMNDVDTRVDDLILIQFPHSEWFERGWTLQELLAPTNIEFFDCNWRSFGTRQGLCREIAQITGIPVPILFDSRNYQLEWTSIAQRMSWASNRQVTREEDVAYCLFGLFNVNMPLLYGEGSEKAFRRLQLEIIQQSDDESILAASGADLLHGDINLLAYDRFKLLATHPKAFLHCGEVQKARPFDKALTPYNMTNKGLNIRCCLYPLTPANVHALKISNERHKAHLRETPLIKFVAKMGCTLRGQALALLLEKPESLREEYRRLGVSLVTGELTAGKWVDILIAEDDPKDSDFGGVWLSLYQELREEIIRTAGGNHTQPRNLQMLEFTLNPKAPPETGDSTYQLVAACGPSTSRIELDFESFLEEAGIPEGRKFIFLKKANRLCSYMKDVDALELVRTREAPDSSIIKDARNTSDGNFTKSKSQEPLQDETPVRKSKSRSMTRIFTFK